MTLAKLLKEKNLLVAQISDLKVKIQRENKTEGENTSKYVLADEYKRLNEVTEKLIATKSAIARANTMVVEKIFRLSELKAKITWLRGLDTTEGTIKRMSYNDNQTVEVYKVQFDRLFVDAEVDALTKQINDLQDELDTYNHVTNTQI